MSSTAPPNHALFPRQMDPNPCMKALSDTTERAKILYAPEGCHYNARQEVIETFARQENEDLSVHEDLGLSQLDLLSLDVPGNPDSVVGEQALLMPADTGLDEEGAGKRQSLAHRKRKLARQERRRPEYRQVSDRTRFEHIQLADTITIANPRFAWSLARVQKGAYAALNASRDVSAKIRYHNAEDFCKRYPDFKYVPWDGRESTAILDSAGVIVAALAGQPNHADFRQDTDAAFAAMQDAWKEACVWESSQEHCRGSFLAINAGVAYGKGQKQPGCLKLKRHVKIIDQLVNNTSIIRLAAYQSSAFQAWQPKVYSYYVKNLKRLYDHIPGLHSVFPKHSAFPAVAFNLGENVWCYKHRDVMNCPFGFCAITALGDFDSTKGGHLILWDLKLIIEFPHGATILVPSAIITHSNIPVQEGDTRVSFTQYCPGPIFRYIDNGFNTKDALKSKDLAMFTEVEQSKEERWAMGCKFLATMNDII